MARTRPPIARLSLAGRTVLITGAAGGIGSATSRVLHGRGANVVVSDPRLDAAEALAAELGGSRVLPVTVDVTSRSTLDVAVEAAIEVFGGLDVVFANAGIAVDPPATVAGVDERDFERVIDVDLLGVWRTVRACLPQLIARRGHVLMTASIYAYFNGVLNAPYAMSKAGVEQLSRALRVELAAYGATAGVLYPGWVDTPIARAAFDPSAPTSGLVERAFPAPLRKPTTPHAVAVAAVRGIERRSARVTIPRRWTPFSLLRGIVNPLTDVKLEADPEVRRVVLEIERGRHSANATRESGDERDRTSHLDSTSGAPRDPRGSA